MGFMKYSLMVRSFFLFCFCLVASHGWAENPIRYVALGDSYTIGTGANPTESWPAVMTSHLQSKGLPVKLVSNLGHNAWTSENLIAAELPILKKLKADFVTVMIGVNDWVRGASPQEFQQRIDYIFSQLIQIVPDSRHIVVITIPDFSVTPVGKRFANGRDISSGIKEFNNIILQEAQAFRLKVVDIYPLSQNMGQDLSLIASDGLHPSARTYAQWADFIELTAVSLLQQT
jgi:acyl-CoA thioesterase-1